MTSLIAELVGIVTGGIIFDIFFRYADPEFVGLNRMGIAYIFMYVLLSFLIKKSS